MYMKVKEYVPYTEGNKFCYKISGKQTERHEIVPYPATSELSLLAATVAQLWLSGPEE